jgi:hypothetical protein
MRKLILAAGILTLTTGLAQAAEEERKISNPTALVESVSADDIAAMLREMGGVDVKISDVKGEKVVSFKDGGVPFDIAITLCEKDAPTKCIGLAQLMMLQDKSYSYETLNTLNVETLTLTLFKKDAYIGLARVELIDGGVTRERVSNAIAWYVAEVHDALKKLTQQVVAGVGADGKTNTLALDAATPPHPIKAAPETVVSIIKTMDRLKEKRPLKKLNVK